jgi:hypothetical protein
MRDTLWLPYYNSFNGRALYKKQKHFSDLKPFAMNEFLSFDFGILSTDCIDVSY